MNDEHRAFGFEHLEPPLEAAVQAALAETLPEDAVERVKTRARQLAATSSSPRRIADARRRGWRASRPIAAGLTLAATLLAMVTGIALLLDYSGGRAFAQMIENVKTAGSVRFTTTTRFGQQPQIDGQMYLKGDRLRFEQFDGVLIQVADLKRQQALILNTVDNEFQQVETGGPMLVGLDDNPIDQLRNVKSDDAESIGQEILRGRRTQVYRLREVSLLGIKGRFETMVWVDVESELPAKIMVRDIDPKHPTEFLFDKFVWNEPLDTQLFSLEAPDGFMPGVILLGAEPKKADAVEPDSAPAFAEGVLRDRVPAHILWSPDGTTITALMRDPESVPLLEQQSSELRQWDVATGHLRWSEKVAGASGLAATVDGKSLATVIGNEVQLRDAASGKVTRTWATDERLSPLAFSPDGKTLAAGISEWGRYGGRGGEISGGVQFWDVERGILVRSITDDKPTTFVRYSVDGKYLATSSKEGPVKSWDVTTGELSRIFPGRGRADLSPDGAMIACPSAVSSRDKTIGRVDLFNFTDGSLVRSFASEKGTSASWLLCVAFSPDSRSLAATDWNGTVILWEVATGERLRTITDHDGGVLSVAFAPDGATVATGGEDKTLRVWELVQPAPERGRRATGQRLPESR